ncbi:MAG: alanine racemase [Bacteroidota bacterium]
MIHTITTPSLLLDKARCMDNIERMVAKATANQVGLRPHFKTHQSLEIGRWFRECGVQRITVSSLRMAAHFAQDGWDDITVAFPVNFLELDRINQLASQIQLNLVVENREALQALEKGLSHSVHVFIKADTGYHRTGLSPHAFDQVDQLIESIQQCSKLTLKGFLAHAGHSYKAKGKSAVLKVHEESLLQFQLFRLRYQDSFPNLIYSAGDTPTCSVANTFPGVDELRPGNFVFYDLSQWQIGSCALDQIAVAMACPVVAKHYDRNEIVVYGGGVHFSKDRVQLANGEIIYGMLVQPQGNSWVIPEMVTPVRSLSQEHGIIRGDQALLDTFSIGELAYILPVHSCMTADLMKRYLVSDGSVIDDVLRLV